MPLSAEASKEFAVAICVLAKVEASKLAAANNSKATANSKSRKSSADCATIAQLAQVTNAKSVRATQELPARFGVALS